jgi:hypothetical protein
VAAEAEWRWCVRALYAVRLDRLAAAGDADALPAYLIEWWTAGRLRCGMGCWVGLTQACCMLGLFWNFLYLFYHDFAKIYDRHKFCKNIHLALWPMVSGT